MNKKEFMIIAKRGYWANEQYVFGVIQGLKMSICEDYDLHTTVCELFPNCCIFCTKTTNDKFKKFKDIIDILYPGLCEYREKSFFELGVHHYAYVYNDPFDKTIYKEQLSYEKGK